MTFNLAFSVSFTHAVMVLLLCCNADGHPPPTGLTYEWLDDFTVNVSWKKPSGLPDNSRPMYLIETKAKPMCLTEGQTSLERTFLTEEFDSDYLTFCIWTVSDCNSQNKSTPAPLKIYPSKSRAELVKDFKCFIDEEQMKCSWIPVRQDVNLMPSFWIYEEGSMKCLKKCDQPYSSGESNGCNLNTTKKYQTDIRILVKTEDAMITFKPLLAVAPPKLTITEGKDYLTLNWTPPINNTCWEVEICYQQCNSPKECQNISNEELTMKVPYDKRCLYEFQSRTWATKYCPNSIYSDFSEPVTYGTNKPPGRMLIVAAIAIPIILAISVILSCYCFRKHSAIFFPIIPDPSVIFKEMIMNGNKDLKTTLGNLYTPVPESIEPCKITPPTEISVLQQHY